MSEFSKLTAEGSRIFVLLDDVYAGRKSLSALAELAREGEGTEGRHINVFGLWVSTKIEEAFRGARRNSTQFTPSAKSFNVEEN